MKLEAIDLIREALCDVCQFLVLRGVGANARVHGDIDVLVDSKRGAEACELVANKAAAREWKLLSFRDLGYVASIVLVRADGAVCDAVKIDFISGLDWYGIGNGSVTKEYFALPHNSDGVKFGPDILASFATFLQKVASSGRLNEKEWQRIRSGGGGDAGLLEIARCLGLSLTMSDIVKPVSRFRQWQIRWMTSGYAGWTGFLIWLARIFAKHAVIKLGMCTRQGFLVSLSGLDGSGKTTQMERLLGCYQQAGCTRPVQVHLLPSWIPMPHKLLRRRTTEANYTRPYYEAPVRSRSNGLLRLGYYMMAFSVARLWLQLGVLRGRLIVLDRSFADFSADLTRSRIPDFRLPPVLLRWLTPSGLLMFLDTAPDQVVIRKRELSLEKATELQLRYRKVFDVIDGEVIDGDGTPDEVFQRILRKIDHAWRTGLGWSLT